MANAIAHQVYVGIGSNVGNKKENFLEAVTRLAKLPDTQDSQRIFALRERTVG